MLFRINGEVLKCGRSPGRRFQTERQPAHRQERFLNEGARSTIVQSEMALDFALVMLLRWPTGQHTLR